MAEERVAVELAVPNMPHFRNVNGRWKQQMTLRAEDQSAFMDWRDTDAPWALLDEILRLRTVVRGQFTDRTDHERTRIPSDQHLSKWE